MSDATCETCRFWERQAGQEEEPNPRGYCHHARAMLGNQDDVNVRAAAWCSEHPLRQRDRLAVMAMQGMMYPDRPIEAECDRDLARRAYEIADAMLAAAAEGKAP